MGKEYFKPVYCHPAYLTYVQFIIGNARLDEAQSGIKIVGRNINNLRYVDDTTLMAESEEQLKSLLMNVKEVSEKAGLKLDIQKSKTMATSPITSWLQSPSTVILEPKKIKSVTVSIISPSICHDVMELDAMIIVFEC